jgi:hypothetical protein
MSPLALVVYLFMAFVVLFLVIACVRAWIVCVIFNYIVDRVKEELKHGKAF